MIVFLLPLSSWASATWAFRAFAPPDEVPFEEVYDIKEAPDGAIWFTSWGRGVARLQGRQWQVFDEEAGLADNFARGLAFDSYGSLWVATQNGLSRIREGRVQTFRTAEVPILTDLHLTSALCLKDGRLWFGTESGSIYQYTPTPDDNTDSSLPAEALKGTWSEVRKSSSWPGSFCWRMLQSRDGTVWVALGSEGVARYQNGAWDDRYVHGGAPLQQIKNLMESRDGRIWISGTLEPYFFENDQWHKIDEGGDTICLAEMPDGDLLGGTSMFGLRQYHEGVWTTLAVAGEIGKPLYRTILFSSTGVGWIGTKEGIVVMSTPFWEKLSHTPTMPPHPTHAFFASPEQPPLAVDIENRLVQYEDNRWNVLAALPGPLAEYQDMTQPFDGQIWVLNGTQVFRFSLPTRTLDQTLDVPKNIEARALLLSSAGDLYVYGIGGAVRWTGTDWRPFAEEWEPAKTHILSMKEMATGEIVVCSGAAMGTDIELWRDGKRQAVLLDQEEATPQRYLTCALPMRDGTIWVGTLGSGTLVIDQNRLVRPLRGEGTQSAHPLFFYEAIDGTLWVGAQYRGLSSYRDERWVSFSHLDGLPNAIAVVMGEHPQGTYWVATRNCGVYRYAPGNEMPATHVETAPSVVPSYSSAVFSFDGFDAWGRTSESALSFSWRVTKLDIPAKEGEWAPFSRQRTIATAKLAPGNYLFEVRAANRDRHVDPTPASARFVVETPFYLRAEFLVPLMFLAALAIGLTLGIRRKHRELLLSQREISRLAQAIEQASEIIVVTDAKGNITYVNPAFEQATGYTREEALGKNPRLLKSDKQTPAFYEHLWRTIRSGRTWSGHFINRRKDGTLYEEEASVTPVRDASGAIVSYVAVKRDITEQIHLENQLRQAQKMEAIGQLAGGVAHDFNNLLQGIQGYTQLAFETLPENDERRHDLQQVLQAAEQASALTRQLLSFSRREMVEPKDINLNQVLADMSKLMGRLIGEDIEMQIHAASGLHTVYADGSQVGQVLLNLCVNARDAMPDGGTLSIETRNAVLDEAFCELYPWAKPGDYVALSVSDTGIGIPQEIQDRIFEPFFTTKELGRGTGLGLATVYGIVKQHEGIITLESEVGRGTTFSIYFPRSTHTTETVFPASPPTPTPHGHETILFGEDEEIVRSLGTHLLEHAGYRVLVARDGREAMALFDRHATEISLALLDVVMPRTNGRTVANYIHSLRPDLPVLFCSGYSVTMLDAEFLNELGAKVIQKPFRPEELLQAVREAINRGHSRSDTPTA